MVFKPFSHLARRSTKAFAHGYAQSLAAASQSSYASTQTPLGQLNHHRFGKTVSLQQRENYHQNALQSSSSLKSSLSGPAEPGSDGNLDAYAAAWQKHQTSEDWQQYAASKRPNWKNRKGFSAILLEKDERPSSSSSVSQRTPAIERAHSAGALDDIRKVRDGKEAIALEEINEAISKEISSIESESFQLLADPDKSSSLSSSDKTHGSEGSAGKHRTDTPTSLQSSELNAYVEQISTCEKSKEYGEIPAIFEAMLRAGLTPPPASYNSLLVAAIRLSTSTAQVVPKALDIYTNMLRRNVVPNDSTYALLLELLALRAMEIVKMQEALANNRLRFRRNDGKDGFMLLSRQAELDLVLEDDSLKVALQIFDFSTTHSVRLILPATTYRYLLEACARQGEVDHMIRVYSHMESNKVVPSAASYPPMIQAFARSGDLRSAVECYNEYKSLAIADDHGEFTLRSRADQQVYSALVRSYVMCGRTSGAGKFLDKVTALLRDTKQEELARETHNIVVLEAFVEEHIVAGHFEEALALCKDALQSTSLQQRALARIASAAADYDQERAAEEAYRSLPATEPTVSTSISMLAMYLRKGDISSARQMWVCLSNTTDPSLDLIEPTVAYSIALIYANSVDEGLMQARSSFRRIRHSPSSKEIDKEVADLIDEGIENIARSIASRGLVPSPEATLDLMWAMTENGGLITPIAEQMLAGLGPGDIGRLSWDNTKLVLQVEARIILEREGGLDNAHVARFTHILETILFNQVPVDEKTSGLVVATLNEIPTSRPDLVAMWDAYSGPASGFEASVGLQRSNKTTSTASTSNVHNNVDPYANTLDTRGSAVIVDELEKQSASPAVCLQEALARLRNIRRAGRHPRYIAYAKLIAAAAREGRTSLVNDLFGLAQRDMPLLTDYAVVKHGWTTILDAMVGATLTLGNRAVAAEYHQQLLNIGAAPSANTFGLYITTLKDSAKTFDEATEAVKIFLRAKAEGVEPSSFLYNALIGKLGKARRIDDCLFYFTEMRARGIRPTSVTYGTIVNALCRVSDERFAEELFDEMESMSNYKPRPAPYNSMMQFFLTTKRDSSKVLEYYRRMQSRNIQPTMHTYKLLIDTYATLDPINFAAAEGVFDTIRASGQTPESVHFASLIHAKGCVLHDMEGARSIFDDCLSNSTLHPHACLYQALFESMVANHCVRDTEPLIQDMRNRQIEMTPYIANTLIHGWALEKDIQKASSAYQSIGKEKREPSTYEAMTRAFLAVEDRGNAAAVVQEMLSRGYPSAVSGKMLELLGHDSVPGSETNLKASETDDLA